MGTIFGYLDAITFSFRLFSQIIWNALELSVYAAMTFTNVDFVNVSWKIYSDKLATLIAPNYPKRRKSFSHIKIEIMNITIFSYKNMTKKWIASRVHFHEKRILWIGNTASAHRFTIVAKCAKTKFIIIWHKAAW